MEPKKINDYINIKKKYKAAIFDLDGVIVDTAKYHYLAWKRLAGELGFEFTEYDNEQLKGISRMQSLERLLKVGDIILTEDEKIALCEKKNNWYVDYILAMDESEILPGAKECLKSLREMGVKVALGSASRNAGIVLKNVGIEELFDAVIDGNKAKKAKPDPEVFLLGAKALGINPDECAVFEDSEAGIQAAKSASMLAIGVGDENILKDADIVVRGFVNFNTGLLFSNKEGSK